MLESLHLFSDHEYMDMEVVTACGVAVPTTVHGRVVPTTTTDDVRPRELGRYGISYELGGQARVIRTPKGIGRMI